MHGGRRREEVVQSQGVLGLLGMGLAGAPGERWRCGGGQQEAAASKRGVMTHGVFLVVVVVVVRCVGLSMWRWRQLTA